MKKREPSYTVGRSIYWCSHYGKLWGSLKVQKLELPYDSAIPLLGIQLEKTKILIWKDTCTPLFIAALFTIANTWKQSKCPLTNEYTKKVWYIHTMGFYSAIKKEWNFVICSNTDGFGKHYAKWNKSEKDKYCMISLLCGICRIFLSH